MGSLHPELRRQLADLGVDPQAAPPDAALWREFLERVSRAYEEGTGDHWRADLQPDEISQRLALAVDASADAIYITGPTGDIEYANRAFAVITGWTLDEVRGQNPRVFKSGRTDPATYDDMWAHLAAGKVWQGRVINRRRVRADDGAVSGEDYWAQTTIAPYHARSGELLGFVALQRDVTDLVRRERAQQGEALAARLRVECGAALQMAAPLAVRVDAALEAIRGALEQGEGGGWTTALCVTAGLDEDDGIEMARGPERALWRAVVEQAAGQPVEGLNAVTQLGPDVGDAESGARMGVVVPLSQGMGLTGRLVMVAREGSPLNDATCDAAVAVAEMISLSIARDRAECATEAARDAAEEAVLVKSRVLANMSHEIRTPLSGMLGMLDLLGASELDSTQRGYLAFAQSSAQTLRTVINDVLDYSRVDAGEIPLEAIAVALGPLVEGVTGLFSEQASRSGIVLSWRVAPDVPGVVVGDPTRLRQVLSNLVSNAVKFTGEGSITVTVDQVERTEGRSLVRFSVADTGIGIPQESLATIFESFAQADRSTARRFGGTGLGLAISRTLVGLMGGEIEVRSTEGVGSTFAFQVPFEVLPTQDAALVDEAAAREAADATTSAPPLTGRVLLVDDNLVNRRVGEGMLARLGLDVEVAANGRDAVARLVTDDFDAVLMDCQMPVMDGFEATRALREWEDGGSRTPVIALTADAMTGAAERCLAAGMDAYLSKPYTFEGLRRALSPWLRPTATA